MEISPVLCFYAVDPTVSTLPASTLCVCVVAVGGTRSESGLYLGDEMHPALCLTATSTCGSYACPVGYGVFTPETSCLSSTCTTGDCCLGMSLCVSFVSMWVGVVASLYMRASACLHCPPCPCDNPLAHTCELEIPFKISKTGTNTRQNLCEHPAKPTKFICCLQL